MIAERLALRPNWPKSTGLLRIRTFCGLYLRLRVAAAVHGRRFPCAERSHTRTMEYVGKDGHIPSEWLHSLKTRMA